jgi:hypothetical protein
MADFELDVTLINNIKFQQVIAEDPDYTHIEIRDINSCVIGFLLIENENNQIKLKFREKYI